LTFVGLDMLEEERATDRHRFTPAKMLLLVARLGSILTTFLANTCQLLTLLPYTTLVSFGIAIRFLVYVCGFAMDNEPDQRCGLYMNSPSKHVSTSTWSKVAFRSNRYPVPCMRDVRQPQRHVPIDLRLPDAPLQTDARPCNVDEDTAVLA
jgi:hypothetical protein